ncbi:hypothetical protein EST38_g3341 [Candolleomyces aberdarensis]|uniref:Cyanovirin-N domain-containing protein n=1 Tax=Candolleomyces aberdarensis TaxID=2316362 RepID=A0A4Q2DQM8_9AGAR|nr:hypothetical protein EST38_g3341 [Candolleomyces aberdarensis]
MTFAKSSTDISIDASTTDLSASCIAMDVGGKNFSANATNIHLIQDTNNRTTYLVANLRDRFGSERPTLLDLNTCIANLDGCLAYFGPSLKE